jgi:uncharacterized protein with FMN-binding domain
MMIEVWHMKRLIASVIVVVAFTFYAIFSRGGSTAQTVADSSSVDSGSAPGVAAAAQPAAVQGSEDSDDSEEYERSGALQPQQQTVTTPASTTGYADGTYTGSRADALYGVVQVRAVVQGGRITSVEFLSQPSGRRESDRINQRATPILIQEAVASQSANVQVVSGATLTSRAFMESLQSALSQA